jgi:hypothetical protein
MGSCLSYTILNTNPSKFSALKACFNVHNSYNTQPSAQTSDLNVYGLF